MFGHSKRRVSLGSVTIGLAATVLLVISIGAGTATAAVAVAPAKHGPAEDLGHGQGGRDPHGHRWNVDQRPDVVRVPVAPLLAQREELLNDPGGDGKDLHARCRATRGRRSGFALRPRTPTAPPRRSPRRPAPSPQLAGTAPANTAPPTITGLAKVGQTLVAGEGAWSGKPTGYTYAWQRCDADVASCANIAGATGKSYTVTRGISRLSPPRRGDGQERARARRPRTRQSPRSSQPTASRSRTNGRRSRSSRPASPARPSTSGSGSATTPART